MSQGSRPQRAPIPVTVVADCPWECRRGAFVGDWAAFAFGSPSLQAAYFKNLENSSTVTITEL